MDRIAQLRDSAGTLLEVSYVQDCGWCLEVRLDLHGGEAWRQPFTGAQKALSPANVSFHSDGVAFTALHQHEALRLSLMDGSFELLSENELMLRSGEAPFSHHREPVQLWEGLMSLKVTDFSWRAPQIPSGSQFESRMVRFAYQRPSGTILGLAGQSGEINRNGYRFELYNTDEFVHTPARRPLYQSWPVLFHRALNQKHWVGIFFDNPSRTFVDLGDFYPEKVTFESLENNQRVYICIADSLSEVSAKMARLLGGHALPPAWALGYQQCRWSYMSTAEIRSVAAKLSAHNVPCDAMYFDIDYMDGYRVFTHDQSHFADLRQCLADLHSAGMRAVCIIDPGVKAEAGNEVREKVASEGKVLTKADGTPFIAKVWPGEVVLPDFGSPETRDVWANLQARWLEKFPFDGIWNDMNEPSNFDGQNSTTSTSHTERGPFRRESNLYGYHMARASLEGWKRTRSLKRPLIISRSGYPGVQRFAVNWQGDNQAWWEHLRLAIDQAIAFSLSGAFYTGADLPGFTGNPPEDLAVRFFQLGAWLPLFRGHSIFFAKDKEPYAFGGVAQELIRFAIQQRYSLAREWYSGFEQACRELRSPLLPVMTEEGTIARDQMLWFNKFLAAPVTERDAETRTIFFPPGLWYRLGAPQEQPLRGPRWQVIPVQLSDSPVFIRGGSVVVRNTPGATMEKTLRGLERIECYRDDSGQAEGYWYDDDLESIAPAAVRREKILVDGSGRVVRQPI